MASFQYKALQADGKVAVGLLEAPTRQDAFKQMAERSLKPITLSEQAGGKSGGKSPAKGAKAGSPEAAGSQKSLFSFGKSSTKVSGKDLENFTRLLSSLLAAGVPLSRAL